MFTFHCNDGDFCVQKVEMMKYGEMLSDIAKDGDKLTVGFDKNDMIIVFHYASIIYSDKPICIPPPCNLYHIFDFFCMERLMDPSLYYNRHDTMAVVDALLVFIGDETSPQPWMNNKLYISILNDMRIKIINNINLVFFYTHMDKIRDLLVKLGIDTDDVLYKLNNYMYYIECMGN